MADLLLTHGYFMFEDPKELQILKPYAPLGILYLCSHLRNEGFRCGCVRHDFLDARASVRIILRTETPSVLGVYANLMTRTNVVDILRVAREAGWQDHRRRSRARRVRAGVPGSRRGLSWSSAKAKFTMEELLRALAQRASRRFGERSPASRFSTQMATMHQTAPRAQIPEPGRTALAGARSHRHRALCKTWRDAHGQGLGLVHHGARMSVQVPLVQSPGFWDDPSPAQSRAGGR